jgi:hypothetical protein
VDGDRRDHPVFGGESVINMKRKLIIAAGNAIVVVAIVLTILAPFLIIAVRTSPVDTSSKCDALGGEYISEFTGPAHCFRIIDGELVDSFVEIPNATK